MPLLKAKMSECGYCPKKFGGVNHKQSLLRHEVDCKERTDVEGPHEILPDLENNPQHLCKYCDNKFKQRDGLISHLISTCKARKAYKNKLTQVDPSTLTPVSPMPSLKSQVKSLHEMIMVLSERLDREIRFYGARENQLRNIPSESYIGDARAGEVKLPVDDRKIIADTLSLNYRHFQSREGALRLREAIRANVRHVINYYPDNE